MTSSKFKPFSQVRPGKLYLRSGSASRLMYQLDPSFHVLNQDRGKHPGVLLFHQSIRTRKSWDDVARQLAAVGINTLTVYNRGTWRERRVVLPVP
jgi:hypothetical protein